MHVRAISQSQIILFHLHIFQILIICTKQKSG